MFLYLFRHDQNMKQYIPEDDFVGLVVDVNCD